MVARAGAGKIVVGDKDITGDVKDLDIKINTDSLKSELDKAMVQALDLDYMTERLDLKQELFDKWHADGDDPR